MTKRISQWAAAIGALVLTVGAHANVDALANGKNVYEGTCIACHGADGTGALPGVPDFTDKGGVLSNPDELLVERVLNGFQSEGSPMAMPAKGGNPNLTESDVRDVVRYLHSEFAR